MTNLCPAVKHGMNGRRDFPGFPKEERKKTNTLFMMQMCKMIFGLYKEKPMSSRHHEGGSRHVRYFSISPGQVQEMIDPPESFEEPMQSWPCHVKACSHTVPTE